MKKSRFIEIIKKLIEREKKIKEASTSANVPGYMTPNAFSGKGKMDRRDSIASGSGYQKVNEVKIGRYDIGMGSKGNGITLWNRNVEKAGDYKSIAHIAPNGKITNYEKRQPKEVTAFIQKIAQGMKDKPKSESVNESINEEKVKKLSVYMPKKTTKELPQIKKFVQRFVPNAKFDMKGNVLHIDGGGKSMKRLSQLIYNEFYVDKVMWNESINEAGLELKKLEDAIKFFKKKIEKQGRITNARDEEHLERLMKVYNDMGGRKIKENNELFEWLQEACWKGYEKKGMKTMFGKRYPNCVKKKKSESVNEVSDKQKRKIYKKAFGKEYDDPKRKQAPLPLDIAYKVALNRLKKKEGVNENSAEKEKIFKYLVKKGDTPTDARYELNRSYDFVKKRYKTASVAKKAQIISDLSKYESVNEAVEMGKGVKKLMKIADEGYGKVGGTTVDSMSANLFKQLYDKANDDIKQKLNKKNEKQLVMIIGRMWKKFGKNVTIGSSV